MAHYVLDTNLVTASAYIHLHLRRSIQSLALTALYLFIVKYNASLAMCLRLSIRSCVSNCIRDCTNERRVKRSV